MGDVRLRIRQLQTASRQNSGSFGYGRKLSETFMIRPDGKAGSFQVRAQKCDDPLYFQKLSARCGQFILFIVYAAGPLTNRAVTAVFSFLKECTANMLVACTGVERVVTFTYWWSYHCWAYVYLVWQRGGYTLLFIQAAKTFWLVLPHFSLRGATRHAKIGTSRLRTMQKPRTEQSSLFVVEWSSFATASVVGFAT